MSSFIETIFRSYRDYANYLWMEVTGRSEHHYFYWLIGLSLLVWFLEFLNPWRKGQPLIRRDFWLDFFYMFFNFFLFSLIVYNALSNVFVDAFNEFLAVLGLENLVAIEIGSWPGWTQYLFLFVFVDFIQWNVHRLLHRVPWLWEFHKVHHSVREMGFAAHLRFHFMETVVYKSIQYIPVAMIGFGIDDFFLVHIIALLIGHLNHANLPWGYGKVGYLFNNPKMHIWHHAKDLPPNHKYGVNFGLSLSLWDYLFGTAYIPKSGKNIELGFEKVEEYPSGFINQVIYPFKKAFKKSKN
ncbi:sterol desaturase family protein [Luteibaculum oceani]|uniref:Sterol desaturase family protein n=1 Tax=Luteibaculum oceani TaxID=1294296 RepID=A0A5C6USJ4_9FLAO|nr:sterol desaturase family protein [Luteibaculum oceani]TXC76217.1 sterol desaturase family protein [Luteibaculum oceani]